MTFVEEINACTRCPLYATRTQAVAGHGPEDAEIVIVGEAPGAEEDASGKPFIGRAGQLLDALLNDAGMDRRQTYITNACKCRPPGNRTPTAKEIKACAPFLARELAEVDPKLIISMGATAVKAVSTEKSIKDARGKPLTLNPQLGTSAAKIVATYHPAAFFHTHSKAVLANIAADLRLATTSSTESDVARTPRRDTLLLPSAGGTEPLDAFERIEQAKAITVDCEWTKGKVGLVWPWSPGAKLYSISISGVVDGVIESVAVAWPQSTYIVQCIKHLLEETPTICHNSIADLTWLYSIGIKPKLHADTLLLAHLLRGPGSNGLESLGSELCGLPAWKRPLWESAPDTDEEWSKLLQYNADDTYATLLVYKALMTQIRDLPKAKQQAFLRLHNRMLIKMVPVYVEMGLNGAGIDVDALEKAGYAQEDLRVRAIEKLAEVGDISVETAALIPPSPKKSLAFLNERNIFVASTGKPILEPISDRHPEVEALLEVRKHNKLITGYTVPWLRLLGAQGTNRLHSVYNPAGTLTGRASAGMGKGNGGSIHQMPRNSDEFQVRKMVIPAPGNVIVGGDASQIELRVVAWIANEKKMIRIYREGGDIHATTAMTVAGLTPERWGRLPDAERKEKRQMAKALNFGLCYGMAAPKFVTYAWINYKQRFTLEEAVANRTRFFSTYPDLMTWHARCNNIANYEQSITTPLGRVYNDVTMLTDAANYPVQGTAYDLIQLSIIYFIELLEQEKLRDKVEMILSVHDSIAGETKLIYAEHVAALLREALAHPPTERLGVALSSIPVPFVGDVGIGPSFGELH